jgi:hypothetical protein
MRNGAKGADMAAENNLYKSGLSMTDYRATKTLRLILATLDSSESSLCSIATPTGSSLAGPAWRESSRLGNMWHSANSRQQWLVWIMRGRFGVEEGTN